MEEKATFEVKEPFTFEPHEWKLVQTNPIVFEALENAVFRFRKWKQGIDFESQDSERAEFKKGTKMEVIAVVGEGGDLIFRFTCNDADISDYSIGSELRSD